MEKEKEKEKEKEEKPRKIKSRLVVRLATFLVSHSPFVSVVCCTAGFVALFLLPLLAKNTYVSENALMPGSANPRFSSRDVLEANRLVKDIIGQRSMEGKAIKIPRLIAQHMEDLGAEVYFHKFYPQRNQFHPLHFFSGTTDLGFMHNNSSCTEIGFSSVGIIRAPRGDGKEAIVLVTPYNPNMIEASEALSLGLAFSVFSHLSRVAWLAKDFVWLAADSRYGEYSAVAAWLRDYHNPDFFSDAGKVGNGMCLENNSLHQNVFKQEPSDVFRRAGTMAAALVLKVMDRKERNEMDSVTIYAEASNGQMPNLDLINIVHYLAVHRQSLRVKIGMIGSLLTSSWVKILGGIQEWLSNMAGKVNPNWKFGIPASDYIEGAATLASSVYYQALGVPTGSHGAFRDYQVDAITLEISSRISLNNEIAQSAILLRGGRLIEGVLRSVNNLLEKFHQSFFLYFLTSPNKFVSVGVYMIAFALLIAPLPIVAAALFSGTYKIASSTTMSNQESFAVKSWHWLPAVRVVFTVHLWAAIVSFLPYPISQVPNQTPTTSMLAWVALSIFTLVVMYLISGSPYSYSRQKEWATLKSVMIAAVSIGLGLMSIVNFATAQLGAMLVVPMCLMMQPLRRQRAVILRAGNLLLGLIGFPPAALLMLKGSMEGFGKVSVGDFWEWAESLWTWNSATYVFLGFVHLPCWVLCVLIFFHP